MVTFNRTTLELKCLKVQPILETVLKPKNEQKVLKMVVIEVPNF